MTSLGQATTRNVRLLVSCISPPPYNITYYNPSTNQSLSFEKFTEVHEIGILFNYEIRHATGVVWGNEDAESISGSLSKWADSAKDFFGGLFGRDGEEDVDDEEGGSHSEGVGSNGAANLLELENYMASEIWANTLQNEEMTWNEDNECMGLVIEEEQINLNEPIMLEGEGDGNEGEESMSDTPAETETKLLGLMHQPLDYVSYNGCTIPDQTCTLINGQVSIAYAGNNEYGAVQTVISQLREGMEAGTFIPPGSPALNLEFQGADVVGGNNGIIQIKQGDMNEPLEEDESNLSKYGTLFVCLVAVLGAGFIAAMVMRYRKRQRRVNQIDLGFEHSFEDYEGQLAMQEQETDKIDAEEDSIRADSPDMMRQVELELPPADANEVEIRWSGSKA